MRLLGLLLLAAAAAYLYKRFVADSDAGLAETQAAEPFSSEQLAEEPASAPEPASSPASQATVVRQAPSQDTIEHPTWLDPADGGSSEGSAPAAGDGG